MKRTTGILAAVGSVVQVIGLAAGLASVANAATDRWIHVRVDGKDGENVNVNVPLALAEKVLPMVHHGGLHQGKLTINGSQFTTQDLRTILDALRSAPDSEFVTIQNKDNDVRVAKSGNNLVVHIREKNKADQRVDVTVPLKVVDALVSESGTTQDIDLAAALHALGEASDATLLVSVQDGDSHVKVWIDMKNESD